jgi:hypothetical protein
MLSRPRRSSCLCRRQRATRRPMVSFHSVSAIDFDVAKFAHTCIVGKEAPHLLDDTSSPFDMTLQSPRIAEVNFLAVSLSLAFIRATQRSKYAIVLQANVSILTVAWIAVSEVLAGRSVGLACSVSLACFVCACSRLTGGSAGCAVGWAGCLGGAACATGWVGLRRRFEFRFVDFGQNAYAD